MYFINGLSLMEFVQFQGQTENLLNLFSYLGTSPHLLFPASGIRPAVCKEFRCNPCSFVILFSVFILFDLKLNAAACLRHT